ncbi:MAG: LysM peptidoglycan-binding domain-containing protein [Phycisphaerae bacterium]|nr:LysM peptidoglycan-binding domain-containing protein [Phycisphaerae bacterium]
MASDAKIGLLLGLVFIFIIALIINGLPSFNENENNNELTTKMVSQQNNPPAIAAKEREVINPRSLVWKKPSEITSPYAGNQDVRLTPVVPESSPAIVIKETMAEQAITAAAQAVAAKDESPKTSSNETVSPKVYVVSKGDSLASIALKFYGSEQGNKKINIAGIFQANRKLLKSPDEISIGQKLIIPPLSVSLQDKGKVAEVFSEKEFAKVESIGSRSLLANDYRPQRQEQTNWHVVQEGDSLWQIASECLGDGNRYREIAKLNASVLDGEDNLSVGMKLKIPAK